ncbi:MAG: DNA topoisomerase 3 [Actinomycetia bacterium]|nr:DNA topoisomerase 3 [Actinomycetes bacterium]
MSKVLIVAEKPSVGRDLADALPGSFAKRKEGHLESDDYIVTWAVGHLVTLAEPEDYDERLKRWRMDDLPIVPDAFKLKPRDAKSHKQLKLIHKLLAREDVSRVINACDSGREGELIFAYVMDTAENGKGKLRNSRIDDAPRPKPVERLWISSMTKQAIREGFERLRPADQLLPLEHAARSRSEADWVVGMNASRAATLRGRAWVGGVVSLGRVQTPTLALIVAREREIRAFVPEPYALVHGTFESPSRAGYTGLWFDPKLADEPERIQSRIKEQARADEIAARVSGKDGTVTSVERKQQTERAPLLYDLTSLQRDAHGRFGFSARRTLGVAQSLYEARKAITYPRTSSRYLSGDMVPLLRQTAEMLTPVAAYEPFARYVIDLFASGKRVPLARIVNDARVDDHHAIIPTDAEHDVGSFTEDELRIFDLIAKRFLAVFHPPAKYAKTTVVTAVDGEHFRTRGKITLAPGWRGVYGVEPDEPRAQDEEQAEGGELPELREGMTVRCTEALAEARVTKPPPRYTEATLLSAMETAGKFVEDEELREVMKKGGLGTPATRAEIIETLIRREYIERSGRSLVPTPSGLQVVTMLEGHKLTRPDLTGEWEKQLLDIEHGSGDRAGFMAQIAGFTAETVERIAALDREKLRPERVELGPCPRCGDETGEIIRENSRAYGCTSWKSREETGCGFVIWKKLMGRTLTPEVARQLLEEGRTSEVLSGFRSRAGKSFRARLVLSEEGKVEFDFPPRPQYGKRDGEQPVGSRE